MRPLTSLILRGQIGIISRRALDGRCSSSHAKNTYVRIGVTVWVRTFKAFRRTPGIGTSRNWFWVDSRWWSSLFTQQGRRWSPDVAPWPSIGYGDFFSYFISTPATFTMEQLASWKQLKACNYLKNNHVRTVFSSACKDGRSVVLKAKVNSSQNSPEQAHAA